MPGIPTSTWSRFRERCRQKLDAEQVKVVLAFWLFGLINNIFYVIILSAALDLVGPDIPKATVLLACIIPGLGTKLVVPYFMHLVSYAHRIILCCILSTTGMLAVALSSPTNITAKIAGIILANVSSGLGEISILALTHFYSTSSLALAGWGSGTGAAGLIGAGAYALATTQLGISVRSTLLSSTVLPLIMLGSFYLILPLQPLKADSDKYHRLSADEGSDDVPEDSNDTSNLLSQPSDQPTNQAYPLQTTLSDLKTKLARARTLVMPFMLPLFIVYVAEYTINQGVSPTLLFDLRGTPFKEYRDFYPTYAALYQLGVFISRSSLAIFRVRQLYVPSFLQILNLALLTVHALWPFLPNVYFVFAICLFEGLLGGLVYVSTYAAVQEEVPESEREFSLGAVSVADSAGIFLAGLIGVGMEKGLCSWQVAHGRDWCTQR